MTLIIGIWWIMGAPCTEAVREKRLESVLKAEIEEEVLPLDDVGSKSGFNASFDPGLRP